MKFSTRELDKISTFADMNAPENPSKLNRQLILFPLPIGELSLDGYFTNIHSEAIKTTKVWVAENARTLRRFISNLKLGVIIDDLIIFELERGYAAQDLEDFLNKHKNEAQIGVVSEAGIPCIADPGNKIVAWAHRTHRTILPLVGPNSIIMAIQSSGLNGQQFIFHGYLPVKTEEFIPFVKSLSNPVWKKYAHTFIETPYRSDKTAQALIKWLPVEAKLSISFDLHGENQQILSQTIGQWKKTGIEIGKLPSVFVVGF
jgi:16S rRNA (cytidine1402-2'-O)-methyltransferase